MAQAAASVAAQQRLLAAAAAWQEEVASLATSLQRARSEAEKAFRRPDAPEPPLPPNMGLEDAPPEIREKLFKMTCGSTPFPPCRDVEASVAALDEDEVAMDGGLGTAPGSPWALRAAGAACLDAEVLPLLQPHVLEALERWQAFSMGLAGGWLGGGCGAAREVLDIVVDGQPRVEVYATHLTNDDYILGASVLAASLFATGTTRPLVALVTSGVTPSGRQALHRAGWAILDVELAGFEGADLPHTRGYFTKIWLWAVPAHSVVYLDTDMIILDSLDHLFETCSGPDGLELAAVPDSQPHMDGELGVQSGAMVLRPSPQRFADLWSCCNGDLRAEGGLAEWKQHEQGFFTQYFHGGNSDEGGGPGAGLRSGWETLPATYNFCVRYAPRPLYEGLSPASAAIVHFACAKPWDASQRYYAAPAYVQLYLDFIRATGIRWLPGLCSMDIERDKEQQALMQKIMESRGGDGRF